MLTFSFNQKCSVNLQRFLNIFSYSQAITKCFHVLQTYNLIPITSAVAINTQISYQLDLLFTPLTPWLHVTRHCFAFNVPIVYHSQSTQWLKKKLFNNFILFIIFQLYTLQNAKKRYLPPNNSLEYVSIRLNFSFSTIPSVFTKNIYVYPSKLL